jgi:hypothetical protein
VRALREVGGGDEEQHHDPVGEEGCGVEQEERREAAGRVRVRDEPAGERTEADPEVHHDALHRERRRPLLGRGEPGEERRLRRPEAADPDPAHGGDEEALPGHLDERVRGVAHGQDRERHREHRLPSVAVDQRPEDGPCDDRDDRVRSEDQPGHRETDPAHVVQVDEEERDDDAVPERVQEAADLQRRHRTREGREVRLDEPAHRGTLASAGRSSV